MLRNPFRSGRRIVQGIDAGSHCAPCTVHPAPRTPPSPWYFFPSCAIIAAEVTISDLQARVERLSLAVDRERDLPAHPDPTEQRLLELTERCTDILNRLSEASQRQTTAMGEIESRLLRELQHTIEHEWKSLRHIHEEPAKQLKDQAAALGEVCISAANLALQGFERAEARFAALERDLQGQLVQLSRDVQTALAQVRREPPQSTALASAAATPFPLDSVMRIHEELRGVEPASVETAALTARLDSLEREVSHERDEREVAQKARSIGRNWRMAIAGLVAAVLVVGVVLAFKLVSNVNARLDDASARVQAAERQAQATSEAASREITSTRADAQKQISEARVAAAKAEIVSGVLAAPDLVRYSLSGAGPAPKAFAQALWSRSHGLVISASGLPATPDSSVYQIWLLSNTAPVSIGTFVTTANSDVTLAIPIPASVPRPITGVMVTFEPAGEQAAPSGPPVLTRTPQ